MTLFLIVPLVAAIFYTGLGYQIARRRPPVTRFVFAVNTLLISQVSFLLVLAGAYLFVTISNGSLVSLVVGIIFEGLSFLNPIVVIMTFIVSFLYYTRLIKQATVAVIVGTGTLSKVVTTIKIVMALGIMLFFSFQTWITPLAKEAVNTYAVWTNNADLIISELNSSFETTDEYTKIAKETNDLTVCDKIKSSFEKNNCYENADPEYPKFLEKCMLYSKHGDLPFANSSQRNCILDKYIWGSFKNNTDIECSFVEKNFKSNTYIQYIREQCVSFNRIQEIIVSGQPERCLGYLKQPITKETGLLFSDPYAACVRNFVGSNEWKNLCQSYSSIIFGDEDGPRFGLSERKEKYLKLAKCPGYDIAGEFVGEFGDTFDVFRPGYPPVYNEQNVQNKF